MALGSIIFFQGDFGRADGLLEESAALAQTAGELSTAAFALGIGTMAAMERGDLEGAERRASASAAAARAAGAPWLECFSLTYKPMGRCTRVTSIAPVRCTNRGSRCFARRVKHGATGIALSDLALLRVVQERHREARAHAARRSRSDASSAIAGPSPGRSGSWPARTQPRTLGTSRAPSRCDGGTARKHRFVRAADVHVVDRRPLFGGVLQELGTEVDTQALASGRRCRSGRQSTTFGSKA